MIATLAVEPSLMEESIATARFAQRVAMIKNNVTLNEQVDLNVLVDHLKHRVRGLEQEVAFLRGGQSYEDDLPQYEQQKVHDAVYSFLKDADEYPPILNDIRKIKLALHILRVRVYTHLQENLTIGAMPRTSRATESSQDDRSACGPRNRTYS